MLAAVAASTARAGDPTMPLSQVQAGMHCTGYSVIHGTDIASFNVDVQAVIQGNAASPTSPGPGSGPAILVHVSGPAVDATGAGEGFSGSPIYCPDQNGVERNIGAIAADVGEYGNDEVLANPIETILTEHPPPAPAGARRDPALRRRARPLASAFTVSGLPARMASILQTSAARSGHRLLVSPAPAPAITGFPLQPLRPGSAVAAGYATGDISAGALGTVAYTDGNIVWAFGHPLDAAGQRSLLLQDAYVYKVISNPGVGLDVSANPTTSYKLGAPGHNVGTVEWDGLNAIVGQLGPLPSLITVHAAAINAATGATQRSTSQVADESALSWPNGTSALALVVPGALAEAEAVVLRGEPARETQSVCLSITVRERAKPLGFCNRYENSGASGPSPEGPGTTAPAELSPVTDIDRAISDLQNFNFGPLHVTDVGVYASVLPTVRQAFLVVALPPRRPVRRGRRARVRLLLREVNGPPTSRTVAVHIPRSLRPGFHLLTLKGRPLDSPGAASASDLLAALAGGGPSSSGSDPGPLTVDDLAGEIAMLGHYDGITGRFLGRAHASRGGDRRIYRDPTMRISGTAIVTLRVAR